MRNILLCTLLVLLSGCGVIPQQLEFRASLLGPIPLNEAGSDPRAAVAMDAPVALYYTVLAAAQTDKRKVYELVDIGIAATDSRCLQWLGRISDTQRQFGLSTKNLSVLQNLGTTALGLGHAGAAVVASYGAINTAISGFTENFNAALLTAPSQHAAKTALLGVMADQAATLRDGAGNMTFPQAYGAIERYGSLCSFETISAVVNNALSVTTTVVQPNGALRSMMRSETPRPKP